MYQRLLPETGHLTVEPDDVVLTPENIAEDIVRHFNPSGRVLDPCRGEGAFSDQMPGCEWCEIREGRDFFEWNEPVDWIVSNPPYSIFSPFLRHSMKVAENIIYLIPIIRIYVSDRLMKDIWTWGGVPEIYVIGGGGEIGFPVGFCIGAVHLQKGYMGGTITSFRSGALGM